MRQDAIVRTAMAGIILALIVGTGLAHAADPLPRIATRPASPYAEYYNTETGERFIPQGNNFIRLDWAGGCPHITLNTGFYDPEDTESAMAQMEQDGYNVLLVMIDRGDATRAANGQYGVGGPTETDTADLYQPYLDNFIDFLKKANAHHLYVIPGFEEIPYNDFYFDLVRADTPPNVAQGHFNTLYLAQGGIDAKKLALQKLVEAVKKVENGTLLSTVLSWSVYKEISLFDDALPFSLSSGTVTTGDGVTYDMADLNSRQACADNNVNHFLNECAAAIKSVDPDALTEAAVFTYGQVGRTGPNGIMDPGTGDHRHPARPRKMFESDIDIITVHAYLEPGRTLLEDLTTSEYGSWDLAQKPMFMGEFCSFWPGYPDIADAVPDLVTHVNDAYALGYMGWMHWTWDTPNQDNIWHALDSGGVINEALKPAARRTSWTFESDGDSEGWSAQAPMNAAVTGGYLTVSTASGDPYLSVASLLIDTVFNQRVRVNMRDTGGTTQMTLYWTTDVDAVWNAAKSLTIDCETAGGFTDCIFDLHDTSAWDDTVTALRLHPFGVAKSLGPIDIDEIEVRDRPFWVVDDDYDGDGDGIPDNVEGDEDFDGDYLPNSHDTDSDGDGISDDDEYQDNPTWDDYDDDGMPNFLDTDSDDDGVSDAAENYWGSDPYNENDTVNLPVAWWPVALALLCVAALALRSSRGKRARTA